MCRWHFFTPIPPVGIGLPKEAGPIFSFVPNSALLIAFDTWAAPLDGLALLTGMLFTRGIFQ